MGVFDRMRGLAREVRQLQGGVDKALKRSALRAQVGEQEAAVREALVQIGEISWRAYEAGAPVPEGAEVPMRALDAARAELSRLEDEIRALEASEPGPGAACPHCGASTTAGQRFCMRCGWSLGDASATVAPAPRHCGSCGASLTPQDAFCGSCGAAAALRAGQGGG